jgi:hypothetical protein
LFPHRPGSPGSRPDAPSGRIAVMVRNALLGLAIGVAPFGLLWLMAVLSDHWDTMVEWVDRLINAEPHDWDDE